jgi:hypothetical protein
VCPNSVVSCCVKRYVRPLRLLDPRRRLLQRQPLYWVHRDRVSGHPIHDQEWSLPHCGAVKLKCTFGSYYLSAFEDNCISFCSYVRVCRNIYFSCIIAITYCSCNIATLSIHVRNALHKVTFQPVCKYHVSFAWRWEYSDEPYLPLQNLDRR